MEVPLLTNLQLNTTIFAEDTAKKVIKHYKSLRGSAKQKFVKQKIQNIVKSVKESVNELQKMSMAGKNQIDGKGLKRIVNAIL